MLTCLYCIASRNRKKREKIEREVFTLLRKEYFKEYMPQKMKVGNHKEYNKFLERRGNVFHFVNEAIENWYENLEKVSGGNIYTDQVVIAIHIAYCTEWA
jgi:hypothetical protein